MPTARELLEQADALMRRNRPRPGGESAGTPPSSPSAANAPSIAQDRSRSPRPIQREPVPAADPRAVREEPPRREPIVPAAASEREPEIPVLTDTVPEPAEDLLDTSDLGAPTEATADDVPLLTDAVEEIDVGIVDEHARGEPSFWDLTARGETSVLGRAPDSVVVVPPPDLPPPGKDPLGLDQPARGFVPSATASAAAAAAARIASELPPPPEEASFPDPPTEVSSLTEQTVEPESGDAALLSEQAAEMASPPAAELTPADDSRDDRAPALAPMDDARIREAAEEISMQVLQRIDIFADTTLRVELGERLKPAVERVSAELVAHINQQVGELLRAFVAEAIEREIENWRDRNRD